jgi:RNA-directed DNA polymerase
VFGLRKDTTGPHREGEEPYPMMHEHEKSDAAIGAEKLANKVERSAAEPVEQRAAAKGNSDQQSTRRAQDRESVSQALERVRQAARQTRKGKSSPRSSTISAPPCYGRLSSH